MPLLRAILVAAVLLGAHPGWANEGTPKPEQDPKLTAAMKEGVRLLSSGNPQEAIPYFDKAAAGYEAKHQDSKAKIYCARSSAESLKYLLLAASTKTAAVVYSSDWAYAYYLKAYALIDLGQVPEGKRLLQRALELSPENAQFLSELGHLYQMEKDWPRAMETFRAAEDAAAVSPERDRNGDVARAWRGMAYVLVEQGKLDEAEKLYRKCLELDKNDRVAQNELGYVLSLKAKQGGR